MNTNRTTPLSNDEKISKLKAQLLELGVDVDSGNSSNADFSEQKIQLDEQIKVMSLIPYNLNLSTKMYGDGTTRQFRKFGEIKSILYKDLIDIMEVHSNFLEAGYFYIMNPAIIRQHGLQEAYSKILTKEKIEEILLANGDSCLALFNTANKGQQEIIIQILVDKVRDNPDSVNLNVIDKINRASGIDIMKKARDEAEIAANQE